VCFAHADVATTGDMGAETEISAFTRLGVLDDVAVSLPTNN